MYSCLLRATTIPGPRLNDDSLFEIYGFFVIDIAWAFDVAAMIVCSPVVKPMVTTPLRFELHA